MTPEPFRKSLAPAIWLAGALILVLVAILAVGWKRKQPGSPETQSAGMPKTDAAPTAKQDGCAPEIDKAIVDVYKLHEDRKWLEAKEAWKDLSGKSDLCPRQKEEIEQNLALAERQQNTQNEWSRPESDAAGRPVTPVPVTTFLAYYPVGRAIRSVAVVNLSGTGSNTRWFFTTTGSFAYQYRVVSETSVIDNTFGTGDTAARFEVNFLEAAQQRAITEFGALRLELPEDSLINDFLVLGDSQLHRFPAYRFVRRIVNFATLADPGLEKTLTFFVKQLRLDKAVVPDDADVEFAAKVTELAGSKLQITYDVKLGITQIVVLSGKPLPKETLESIACHSSLLMDYYLFPATNKKVGDSWPVDASEIASLVSDGVGIGASGQLTVTRKPDVERDMQPLAQLELSGGNIFLEADDEGFRRQATLTPIGSEILFNVADKLVHQAKAKWRATDTKFSTNHLLFGTKVMHDVEMESFYWARSLKPKTAPGKADSSPAPQTGKPTK